MTINYIHEPKIDWISRELNVHPTKIPYYGEVYKIYLGYRQCYSKVPEMEKELTEKDFTELEELYKKHIVESVLAENKFGKSVDMLKLGDKVFYDKNDPDYSERNGSDQVAQRLYNHFVRNTGIVNFTGFLRYCKFIKGHVNHQSPIEHGTFTFKLSNVSRSLTHQLVRHRLASYSQLSQRYVGERGDLDIVAPSKIRDNEEAFAIFDKHMQQVAEDIAKLRDAGIKNEDIRAIYPNAISTQILVTMNFREVMHFISLRMSPHAQEEIRDVAWKIWSELNTYIPFVFADIKND